MHARQLALSAVLLTAAAVVAPVVVVVGVVAACWLLPFVVLAGPFVHAKHRRRLSEAARRTRCGECGRRLDEGAVKRAQEWSRRAARDEWQARVRDVDAICGHCGAWHVFDCERERFKVTNRPPGVHP